MSADEDTELRDLVANTLESNGVLGKIRAQLRASVFLALDEQDAAQNKPPIVNQDLKKFATTKEGRVVVSLVREFLDHFSLEFTAAVFDPETATAGTTSSRDDLARELNIIESDGSHQSPLLTEVVKRLGGDSRSPHRSTSHDPEDDIDEDLSSKHIAEARTKFEQYDKDRSGTIEKDELRSLFMDMFPHFHINMLERYVTDEFKAIDKDFSNTIDFDEFLEMYKRLFVLCKSVVSQDVTDLTHQSPRRLADTPTKIPAPIKKGGPVQNGVNGEAKGKKPTESSSGTRHQPSKSGDSSPDTDPFFDEPLRSDNKPQSKDDKKSKSQLPKPSSGGSSGMTSLAGLPALSSGGGVGSLRDAPPLPGVNKENNNSLEKDLKAIDKRITDLGFDVPDDDDYEDDFQSSVSARTLSARSEKSRQSGPGEKSMDEDIDEEILEDISIGDDLLRSSHSGMDDLTTDRTISQASMGGFDYVEEVKSP